jgi:hypothetical protein
VLLPTKKNYIPQFLKQRDINSYNPTFTLPVFERAAVTAKIFMLFNIG